MQLRKKITIKSDRLCEKELSGFPLFLEIKENALNAAAGKARADGLSPAEMISFTDGSGRVALPFEVSEYDRERGILRVWVKIPRLSPESDTTIYFCIGEDPSGAGNDPRHVWAGDYRLVIHGTHNGTEARDSSASTHVVAPYTEHGILGRPLKINSSSALQTGESLTLEALVESGSGQTEGFQTLLAKWSSPSTFQEFKAFDAGNIRGMSSKGFFGAVFDGRYVYFVPQYDGTARHGKVLRYDTEKTFDAEESWQVYDAGETSGLNTKGYYGAVATGRYVYFVPRFDGQDHHSRLLRYDTEGDFEDPAAWEAHDAGETVSYQGAAFDGRYIYFSPGYADKQDGESHHQATGAANEPSGRVLRHDTQGDFHSPNSYAVYDAGRTSGLAAKCFDGPTFDGTFVYFVPLEGTGILLRYDTREEFSARGSWEGFDYNSRFDPKMGWSVGAVFDGRYIYYTPYSGEVAVRYDTHLPFTEAGAWEGFVPGEHSAIPLRGYDGAAFDGRYVYFIPFMDTRADSTDWHAEMLRFDTLGEFKSESSWQSIDAQKLTNPKTGGFNGGAFDGRFLYCAPWREGTHDDGRPIAHGKVLRYDTTGGEASFGLHYTSCGHNGGLCASLPGPTFQLNTERGAFNLCAHRSLSKGEHYLAAVYDGKSLKLYVDGELWAEKPASGRVQTNNTDLTVGRMLCGRGYFQGAIREIRVSAVPRSAGWLEATYKNLTAGADYYTLEGGDGR